MYMSPVLPDSLHNLSSYSRLTIHLQNACNLHLCVRVFRRNFMKEILLEKLIFSQTKKELPTSYET
jgi:hypothetical protein